LETKITTRQWININKHKYESNTLLIKDCMTALNVSYSATYKMLKKVNGSSVNKKRKKSKGALQNAMSVESFKAEFDVPQKIKNGLERLGNNIIKDADFRRELGIPIDKWKKAVTHDDLTSNQLEVKQKNRQYVIWGKEGVLTSLQEVIDVA
jgi:hypothetical protein